MRINTQLQKIWTQEEIIKETQKHKTVRDWRNSSPTSYRRALDLNILKEAAKGLIVTLDDNPILSNQILIDDAAKYPTKREWLKHSRSNYKLAAKRKILDQITSHMPDSISHWTRDKIIKTAKNYDLLSNWRSDVFSGARFAPFFNCVDECLINFDTGRKIRVTNQEIIERSKKYKHWSDWVEAEGGSLSILAAQRGIRHLCGPYGSSRRNMRWTEEMLIDDAQRFKTRLEWQKGSPTAYQRAHDLKILEKCCVHMKVLRKRWTDDELIAEVRKYTDRLSWRKSSRATYSLAQRRGLMHECCAHMPNIEFRTRWTVEACLTEARKYSTKEEWRKNSRRSYDAAHRFQCIKECSKHMKSVPRGKRA